MKKILISTILVLVAAVSYGQLDTINVGAYNNDPSAEKLRPSFIKTNAGINLMNNLRLYNLNYTELAVLDGALVSTTELNRLVGVTSAVQTQINARVRSADSTGNAAGNYVSRKALVDSVAIRDAAIALKLATADSTVVFATPTQISDTLIQRISAATVGVAVQDSNLYGGYTTRTYVESLLGSGSGLSAQTLAFIIGVTTGAPSAGDSTIVHTAFEGKHIDVYRSLNTITGGAKQFQNFTATNTVDGFRLNSSTVTVNPVWVDGEQVLVDIIQPILWSYLSLTGQESSLLDSLRGYWKLDETSGTIVDDATDVQNGTTTALVNQTGKLGRAYEYDAASDITIIPYNTNVTPKGADFSVSIWFKIDSLPTVTGRSNYLMQVGNNAVPYLAHSISVDNSDNKILVRSLNTSATVYTVNSSGALSVDTWYHLVFVNRGNGQTLQLYLNGTDVSATAGTFTGTVFEGLATNNMNFGNSYSGAPNSYLDGTLDSFGVWGRALTSGEVTTLYNSGNGRTHPFN